MRPSLGKFLMITLIISIFSVGVASAAPTCGTATLDTYLVPSFSCQLDNLLFSNWSYSPNASPSGVAIPASGVTVTPDFTFLDEGFQFSGGWSVGTQSNGASSFQDSLISFTVTTVNGQNTLHDLDLFFNGSETGTGLSGVTENYCKGAGLQSCPGGSSGQIHVTNPPAGFNDNVTFNGTYSTLGISKDINVTSGTAGTANISQVTNHFSQVSSVPEPVTLSSIGGGLLALGLFRRRTNHTKQ